VDHRQLKELLEQLMPLMTPNKQQRCKAVVADRTRHLTVMLEDVYQPHNASAILRSCECFGVQDLHIVEKTNEYLATSTAARGAAKWVDVHKYKTTADCVKELKQNGYRIVATTPHEKDHLLADLPINQKTVLIFGTEGEGVSKEVCDLADDFVKIPMFGFTESFNVSVSVALCLYDLTRRLHESNVEWRLSEHEQNEILRRWVHAVSRSAKQQEELFLKE
jgi:tRNA (guanosine-2'-O-)-methyltransferase